MYSDTDIRHAVITIYTMKFPNFGAYVVFISCVFFLFSFFPRSFKILSKSFHLFRISTWRGVFAPLLVTIANYPRSQWRSNRERGGGWGDRSIARYSYVMLFFLQTVVARQARGGPPLGHRHPPALQKFTTSREDQWN